MPSAREYAGAAAAGGKIYVIGGYDGQKALAVNEAYYPQRDGDGEEPWEEKAPLPEGRYGMGVTSLADNVFVVGGVSEGQEDSTIPYEWITQDSQWAQFDRPSYPMGNFLALISFDDSIYGLGGKETASSSSLARVQSYQAFYTISVPIIIK